MRTVTITIINPETGRERQHSFKVDEDEALSVDVERDGENLGLAFHDWGFAPEDSAMYKDHGMAPDYAVSLPGDGEVLVELRESGFAMLAQAVS